jgi:transposase-like protein
MTIQCISALNDTIGSIQLKLFDFGREEINFEDKIEENVFKEEKTKNINKNVHILKERHFEMLNPICPYCNSIKHTKQGFYQIKPKFDNDKKVKIHLQRYKCKKCDKKYSTNLFNIKEENKSYLNTIKEKTRQSKLFRGGSLRNIALDFKIFKNMTISHTTIKNFLKIDENKINRKNNRISQKIKQLSGYLIIDEQFIKCDKKKIYRVTLHDKHIKNPIAEEIMESRTKENILSLIKEVTKGHKIKSITTDGFQTYESVAEELNIKHQTCIFHMFKSIRKEILDDLKKNKYTELEIISTLHYLTELQNVFRTYNYDECLELFEELLNKSKYFKPILIEMISEKIIPNFNRLTEYMRDNSIPRTSNKAEQEYSKTKPYEIKRKYKTINGILEYLALNMTKKPI